MFVMSFTSVVVDRASFKKTSEMAKVKSFDCQLQISKSTTLLQISVKFMHFYLYFVYGAGCLFVSRPFARPESQKELKLFLRSYKRRPHYCSPVSRSDYTFFTAQTMMPTGVLLF